LGVKQAAAVGRKVGSRQTGWSTKNGGGWKGMDRSRRAIGKK
jgi:hypothetical protein